MNFLEFFRSRYVRSLEQQIVELKAEKAEQKAEIARLNQCLVPALRAMEREKQQLTTSVQLPGRVIARKPAVDKDATVERMPPVRNWMQTRSQLEQLTDNDEARLKHARAQGE